jgi:hypothetical protein
MRETANTSGGAHLARMLEFRSLLIGPRFGYTCVFGLCSAAMFTTFQALEWIYRLIGDVSTIERNFENFATI